VKHGRKINTGGVIEVLSSPPRDEDTLPPNAEIGEAAEILSGWMWLQCQWRTERWPHRRLQRLRRLPSTNSIAQGNASRLTAHRTNTTIIPRPTSEPVTERPALLH